MRMHHVGVVVVKIEGVGRASMEQLGLRPLTAVIADPVQRVKVQFWGRDADTTAIELIEADAEDAPVAGAMAKGGGLNHICYEVDDLEAARAEVLSRGALSVVAPVPAVAFGGRPIAFFFVRGLGLIEYVQAAPRASEKP